MAEGVFDLPSLVHSHCLFFDRLVELIPPKFYIPNEEEHDSWTFRKNKAAKAAAKIKTRENLKKAKRKRLDPDQFKSTVQVLQQKKVETREKEAEAGAKAPLADNADRAVTYEELRERLHKRISMLRAKRHAETAAAATMSARTFQNEKKEESARTFQNEKEKKNESLKRRLKAGANEPKDVTEPEASKASSSREQPPNKRQKKTPSPLENQKKKETVIEVDELEFGRVKMGLDNAVAGGKKRRKDTKEQLLKKATELQEKMQDPDKGQEVISQHSWAAAVSRAAGEKVLDNPKLIKKSMRRDQQQTVKSAKKWQERKHYEKKGQSEKQKTRKDNITQRLESIKDRKIAKREKKLMRPGFEGRKAGFINT